MELFQLISFLLSVETPTLSLSYDENVDEDALEDNDKLEKRDAEAKELLKEIMDLLSSIPENMSSLQSADVPQVDVWDTGKTWELEYRLQPDRSIDDISSRLFNQVWDLLQILQERVAPRSCNNKDLPLIDGLKAISVLPFRLGRFTEKALKR